MCLKNPNSYFLLVASTDIISGELWIIYVQIFFKRAKDKTVQQPATGLRYKGKVTLRKHNYI